MKIGINGQRLLIENPAGPEIYTYNIINALAKIDHDNMYVIYFDKSPTPQYFAALTKSNHCFSYKVVRPFVSWTQISLALELLLHPVDVFFTAVHTMPIVHLPQAKIVAMIHGLEYKYNSIVKSAWPLWYTALFSTKIIVPSQYTKTQLLQKRWGVKENKLAIISEGVDDKFYKRPQTEINQVTAKYNISDTPYLLFVSTIQPRKNLPKLVEGFSMFAKNNPKFKLCISGKLGWNYEESITSPKKFGVEDSVLFLGRTSDSELPALLSGATAFVSTSLEEGFGLPLLEALACETPCLVSDIDAFKALGKAFVMYVDPHDSLAIAESLQKVCETVHDDSLKQARDYAKNLTWENSAKETLTVFKNL